MLRRTVVALGLWSAAHGALGCAAKTDEGDKFREALPATSDVNLSVPRSGDATSAQTLAIGSSDGTSGYAKFYTFTRIVTGAILGTLWLVVHTHPTTIDEHQATWGPGSGDALSPVVWRLTVKEVGN